LPKQTIATVAFVRSS